MNVFAYCTQPARRAVKAATGVIPLTSPPFTADVISPRMLEERDLLYFRLHGVPGHEGVWYGEGKTVKRVPALRTGHIDGADLSGAVVVIANCYSEEDEPMVAACYRAGASAVIAGPGPNYAAGKRVVGTDLLVKWLLYGLRLGLGPKRALQMARMRLKATSWRGPDRDALAFKIQQREV